MKKASFFIVGVFSLFLISAPSVGAQTPPICPVGYFQHGEFCCNSDSDFEKPASAGVGILSKKFCQPQIAGCQETGGKFCTAGTRNYCCSAASACGRGTAYGFEVAVCVPPTSSICGPKSPGYAGTTKEGKNICCRAGQEPGPAGGTKAPYCQPVSRSACAPGERFIQGTGAYQNEKRCCSANTVPSRHPNGLPFCASLPLTVLAPNGGEQIPPGPYQVKWMTNNLPPTRQITLKMVSSQGRVAYQNNFSNTGSQSLNFQSPPGQYKIEASATIGGETVTDQSDNFFTLISGGDTTPPTIRLTSPALGVLPNTSSVSFSVQVNDASGLAYTTIMIIAPNSNSPLAKTCDHTTFHPPFTGCSLAVPKSQIIPGTTVLISAIDYSPNRNTAYDGYIIERSGQLQGD
ncbi:MAG: hypothetical protein HYT46_01065 [Candidatus Vogelbacteria bacterium]|nr:hypothetical protein [Candidatus Vogelbacteria bacterium]